LVKFQVLSPTSQTLERSRRSGNAAPTSFRQFVQRFTDSFDSSAEQLWIAAHSNSNVLRRFEEPAGHDCRFTLFQQPLTKLLDIDIWQSWKRCCTEIGWHNLDAIARLIPLIQCRAISFQHRFGARRDFGKLIDREHAESLHHIRRARCKNVVEPADFSGELWFGKNPPATKAA